MSKIPKGTPVRLTKHNVVMLKLARHSVPGKFGNNFNIDGYRYLPQPECNICGTRWENFYNLYIDKEFTIASSHKKGPNYLYELAWKGHELSGFVDSDGDSQPAEVCQHMLNQIKIVRGNGNRLNFVMESAEEKQHEQVKPQQHITNGIDF